MPPLLHARVAAKGFQPRHVAEVGVFRPEDSNVYAWVAAGIRATLVEADPRHAEAIRQHFAGCPQLTVHAVAVCDFQGEVQLHRAGPSTFLAGLHSPAVINDGYQENPADVFTAPAVLFSDLDPGDIDLLSLDVEGAEWFALQHLRSRPAVISVETHGARYRNPHRAEIEAWMAREGYEAWYLDRTDTVYVRPDRIPLTALDRLRRGTRRAAVALRRLRKRWLG
jgi:FkbM family methyltransferase